MGRVGACVRPTPEAYMMKTEWQSIHDIKESETNLHMCLSRITGYP